MEAIPTPRLDRLIAEFMQAGASFEDADTMARDSLKGQASIVCDSLDYAAKCLTESFEILKKK